MKVTYLRESGREKSVMAGLAHQLCMPVACIGYYLITVPSVNKDGGWGLAMTIGGKCLPDGRQVNRNYLTKLNKMREERKCLVLKKVYSIKQ